MYSKKSPFPIRCCDNTMLRVSSRKRRRHLKNLMWLQQCVLHYSVQTTEKSEGSDVTTAMRVALQRWNDREIRRIWYNYSNACCTTAFKRQRNPKDLMWLQQWYIAQQLSHFTDSHVHPPWRRVLFSIGLVGAPRSVFQSVFFKTEDVMVMGSEHMYANTLHQGKHTYINTYIYMYRYMSVYVNLYICICICIYIYICFLPRGGG